MSLYGNKKNVGYNTYGTTEPVVYGGIANPDHVRRPVMMDAEGRRHAIVGYAAARNSQTYLTTTEEVVEFSHVPAIAHHNQGPARKGWYKDLGVGNNPLLVPWSSTLEQPDKAGEFSPPRVRNQVVQGQSRVDSPRNNVNRDKSPSSGDHYYTTRDYGKYNNPSSDDEEDDDVICDDGVCYKIKKGGAKSNHLKEEDYDKEKHKGNGYAPHTYTVPHSTQPRKDSYYEKPYTDLNNEKHKGNGYVPPSVPTQPRKDTSYDTSNKGNGYVPPSVPTQPRKDTFYDTSNKGTGYVPPSVPTQPRKDTYYDTSNKGNGYVPPSVPTQPRKDTYYETSYPNNNDKQTGSGYAPPYTVPVTTQPQKDTYYDTSNNRPTLNNLPPIKTDSDKNRTNSPRPVGVPQPQFNASPRKDQGYKDTIDSTEARRRYGKAPPQAGAYAETGTIDSREAARKYNGVFVPN